MFWLRNMKNNFQLPVLIWRPGVTDLKLKASRFLKIGTCPASQKILAYMGKNLIFTRNIKIFTCPASDLCIKSVYKILNIVIVHAHPVSDLFIKSLYE